MAVAHRKICLKQKKVGFCRQIDVLYNLRRLKMKFGKKSFIPKPGSLENQHMKA
jgi:hypothetical protein